MKVSESFEQANTLYFKLFNINNLSLNFRENYYIIVFIFSLLTFFLGLFWDKYQFSNFVQYRF